MTRKKQFGQNMIDMERILARLFIISYIYPNILCFSDGALFLFCGDILFVGGCGRFFEGDAKAMYKTLYGEKVLVQLRITPLFTVGMSIP